MTEVRSMDLQVYGAWLQEPASAPEMKVISFEDLDLPSGLGYRVGASTGINYIVLVAHYHIHGQDVPDSLKVGRTKETRVTVKLEHDSPTRRIRSAALFELKIPASVVPASTSLMLITSARIDWEIQMHPVLAFIHTHGHFTSAALHKVSPDGKETLHSQD